MAEVRMMLDHIEKYAASLSDADRRNPPSATRSTRIVHDDAARARYLEFTRDADEPAVRVRMIELARNLGWLSQEDQRAELMRMIGDQLAGNSVGSGDVDLVCGLNKDHGLDRRAPSLPMSRPRRRARIPNAAVLACLGSAGARARVLQRADQRERRRREDRAGLPAPPSAYRR